MAITVEVSRGKRIYAEGGVPDSRCDSQCTIAFPDDAKCKHEHLLLQRVANHWILVIDAQTEGHIHVNDAAPVRMDRLIEQNDLVTVSERGPKLTFRPTMSEQVASPEAAGFANSPKTVRSRPERPLPPSNPILWVVAGGTLTLGAILTVVLVLWLAGAFPSNTAPRQAALVGVQSEVQPAVVPRVRSAAQADVEHKTAPDVGISAAVGMGPEAQLKAEPIAASAGSATGGIATGGTPEAAKPVEPNLSLYSVLVTNPKREQVFQLGSAWAASEHQLVTSAAIVMAIEDLGDIVSVATVRCSTLDKEFVVTDLKVHPAFTEAFAAAQRARRDADVQRRAWEQTQDPQARKKLQRALLAAQRRQYQALERRAYYDVGIIEVDAALPAFLPIADPPTEPTAGDRVALVGVPFNSDDYIVDPQSPATPSKHTVEIVRRRALFDAPGKPHRLLFTSRLDLSSQNWSGSPILNSAGRVIAVYSRATPPPFESGRPDRPDRRPSSHDATEIARLRDFIVIPSE